MVLNEANPLAVSLGALKLQSPVILASGTCGYGLEMLRIRDFDFRQVGAITLKGTTMEPRRGNPQPRICETPSGLLNSIGLENPGIDFVQQQILPQLSQLDTIIIGQAAGFSVEEYAYVASRLASSENVHAVEINISCPNVKAGGAAFGADAHSAFGVIDEVKRNIDSKPIIAKLNPNVTSITEIAAAVIQAGADMISMTNTFKGMEIDLAIGKPYFANTVAGLSGPAIFPLSLARVYEVYQYISRERLDIPIIGMGGVSCGNDALKMILSGASAVGVGTAVMTNPLIAAQINEHLHRFIADCPWKKPGVQLNRISDLVGWAHRTTKAQGGK